MIKIPYSQFVERRKGNAGSSRVKCSECGIVKRVLYMALFKRRIFCSICRPNKIRKSWEPKK